MSFMEDIENHQLWLQELVNKTAAYPGGLDKMIFELQTVNWKNKQDIPISVFIEQVQLLQKNGTKHIAYYPDNLHHDHPKLEELKKLFPREF